MNVEVGDRFSVHIVRISNTDGVAYTENGELVLVEECVSVNKDTYVEVINVGQQTIFAREISVKSPSKKAKMIKDSPYQVDCDEMGNEDENESFGGSE